MKTKEEIYNRIISYTNNVCIVDHELYIKAKHFIPVMQEYAQQFQKPEKMTEEELKKLANLYVAVVMNEMKPRSIIPKIKEAFIRGGLVIRDKTLLKKPEINLRDELIKEIEKIKIRAQNTIKDWANDMCEHSIEARGIIMACNYFDEYLKQTKR